MRSFALLLCYIIIIVLLVAVVQVVIIALCFYSGSVETLGNRFFLCWEFRSPSASPTIGSHLVVIQWGSCSWPFCSNKCAIFIMQCFERLFLFILYSVEEKWQCKFAVFRPVCQSNRCRNVDVNIELINTVYSFCKAYISCLQQDIYLIFTWKDELFVQDFFYSRVKKESTIQQETMHFYRLLYWGYNW